MLCTVHGKWPSGVRHAGQLLVFQTVVTNVLHGSAYLWKGGQSVHSSFLPTVRNFQLHTDSVHTHEAPAKILVKTLALCHYLLIVLQGMSDLASPILYVMRNEAEAFWCFTALMRRLEGNFQTDSMYDSLSCLHCPL